MAVAGTVTGSFWLSQQPGAPAVLGFYPEVRRSAELGAHAGLRSAAWPGTAGTLCFPAHEAMHCPSSAATRPGSVCQNCAHGNMLMHMPNCPNLPGLLVWVFIALVCFVFNGESSSARPFLSLLTSVAFFSAFQKFHSQKQLVGACQVLRLQEEHVLPYPVPFLFLSHPCSEVISRFPRGTRHHPVLCPPLSRRRQP